MDTSREAVVQLQHPVEDRPQEVITYAVEDSNEREQRRAKVVCGTLLCFIFIIVAVLAKLGTRTTIIYYTNDNEKSNIDDNEVTIEKLHLYASIVGSKRPTPLEIVQLEAKGGICTTKTCIDAAAIFLTSINFYHDPCKDFYEFACGKRIVRDPIDHFTYIRHNVTETVKGILNNSDIGKGKSSSDSAPLRQARILYKGCVDTKKLDLIGLKPLREVLKSFGDWPILHPSPDQKWNSVNFNWIDAIAKLTREFQVSALIGVQVLQDYKNVSSNIIYITQPDSIMSPEKLVDEDSTAIPAYRTLIREVVRQFLAEDKIVYNKQFIDNEINNVVDFVMELGKISGKKEDSRNAERIYNKHNLKWLQRRTRNITGELQNLDWMQLLNAVFSSTNITVQSHEAVIVKELDYLHGLTKLLSKTPARVVSNYLGLRLVYEIGQHTTHEMREAIANFQKVYVGLLAATTVARDRGCAKYIASSGFGWPISIKYVEQYFHSESKTKVSSIVENIVVAFEETLTNIAGNPDSWLDSSTSAKAISKLDKLKKCIGHPDWMKNETIVHKLFEGYNRLKISADYDYFTNIKNLLSWKNFEILSELRIPRDKDDALDDGCASDPRDANAFYYALENSITLPAASLQNPFFDAGLPSYLNYAGIGTIAGHEITHAFDSTGSQFDENGTLSNWWSNDSMTKYQQKTKCLENQYNAFKPKGVNLNVNGKLTIDENIADNGGLNSALLAYQKSVKSSSRPDQLLPGIEQYNQQQLFFLGFANVWCEGQTPEELEAQILTDFHAPPKYRVLGSLINNREFAKTWNCKLGSPMNPKNEDKCHLWE